MEEYAALELELAEAREALRRIERWFGEFPPTGRYWDEPQNTRPMTYGAAFGSNGERDYMRGLARAILSRDEKGERR